MNKRGGDSRKEALLRSKHERNTEDESETLQFPKGN